MLRSRYRLWICRCALLLAVGCGGTLANVEDHGVLLERAVEASLDASWGDAARAAFAVSRTTSVDQAQHDRALLLLARASEELGLRHAASLWYLEVASARRHVDLLPEAIEGLERITQRGAHDHPTLVGGYLASADIGSIGGPQDDFVAYLQGVDSLRRGRTAWAERSFASIQDGGPYRYRADYVDAIKLLATGQHERAEKRLSEVARAKHAPQDARDEARLALARLSMEQRRYEAAAERYAELRDLAPKRPELLLEMAWAHYYLGDVRRALGLLVALDAPVYRGLIAPERFLLEALCLRRLCQFDQARVAALRLRRAYGDALEALHSGVQPHASEALRDAARQRGQAREAARYRRRLSLERAHAADLGGGLGEELEARIEALYAAGEQEAARREEAALRVETLRLGQELLSSEDGVRIVIHELSVGLLRGREREGGTTAPPELDLSTDTDDVAYSFAAEFWTDELDDLVVTIEDRCLP